MEMMFCNIYSILKFIFDSARVSDVTFMDGCCMPHPIFERRSNTEYVLGQFEDFIDTRIGGDNLQISVVCDEPLV